LPEERLVMNRTGSMASRVPPADTSTRTPVRSWPAAGRGNPQLRPWCCQISKLTLPR